MPARCIFQRHCSGPLVQLLLSSCLLMAAMQAAVAEDETGVEFLAAIAGDWQGRAVQTPSGPFNYDIRFAPDAEGCMGGVAEPGGVHHRWRFCPAGSALALEFLSDFAGNDRPLFLQLDRVDAGTLVFRSGTLDFLKVLARVEQDCLRFQVLHHDRLHVEIHLRRPSATAAAAACPWPAPVSETQ